MMRFIHVAVAVLSLLSAGQSAPVTNCESLIQPLDITGREQLLGKWWQVAESINHSILEQIIKSFRESGWSKMSAANESDAIDVLGVGKMFGACFTTTLKMTLENNTLQPVSPTVNVPPGFSLMFIPVNLLKAGCSDCLLIQVTGQMFGGTYSALRLLSKRRTVTAAEMEEFKKQAECLNLPQPIVSNPEGGVCPEPDTEGTEIIHEPRFSLNGKPMDFMNITQRIVSNAGGPKKFIDMISNVLSENDSGVSETIQSNSN